MDLTELILALDRTWLRLPKGHSGWLAMASGRLSTPDKSQWLECFDSKQTRTQLLVLFVTSDRRWLQVAFEFS